MQKISSKDLPGSPPIFICKSSLVEIKEFRLDLCQAMRASSCEMQISCFLHQSFANYKRLLE